MKRLASLLLVLLAGLLPLQLVAEDAKDAALSAQLQDVKSQVLELNRDLFILEEELLFPANTQVAVFVSVDAGEFFALDSVEIKIDDKIVTHYLYTEKQTDALRRGGVHRIYVGNLRTGKHELTAFFIGKGPENREFKRATTAAFEKGTDPKMLELKITDAARNYQPEFAVVEWQ
jgi:hypothetical protein